MKANIPMKSESTKKFENISEDHPKELEKILGVLSNQLRRDIIRCLAREDNYLAQLAAEVKTTPQALVKHLKILEEHGIIRSQIGSSDNKFNVRAVTKEDKKIKYYALNKNVNLKINFGLGYYELGGTIWKTEELKQEREVARQKYEELLLEFADLESYIKAQLDESIKIDESLGKMNDLLGKFGELEKFLIIERQLILIKKLKSAVGILTGEEVRKLRPIFFQLLHISDPDDEKFITFETKLRELLPGPKADQTLKLLDRASATIE